LVVPRYTRLALPPHGVRYLAASLADRELLRRVGAHSRIEALQKLEPPELHVRILDLSVAPEDFDLNCFLSAFQPSLVGVNANAHSIGAAQQIAALVKRNQQTKHALRIVGGYLPSARPELALKSHFQIAALGFGEETLAELVLAQHGLERSAFWSALPQIPGIAYKDAREEVRENARRAAVIPLDDLPFPHRADQLQVFNDYPGLEEGRQGSIIGARGCVFDCKYCCGQTVTLRRVSRRSPENILAEIDELYRLGRRNFLFDEEDFMLRPRAEIRRLVAGLKLLKDRDPAFIWAIETRGDRLSDESILAMASAGLKEMAFGTETLDQQLARRIKNDPRLSVAAIERATRTAQAAGIRVDYNLMIGTPGYGWREILTTAIGLKRTPPDFGITGAFHFYPGCAFYEALPAPERKKLDGQMISNNDPDNGYPTLPTAEMTEAEIGSAEEEIEIFLFCQAQAEQLPDERGDWARAGVDLIIEAFRINASYDLFLNSGGSGQPRKDLLANLSARANAFFHARARSIAGFSNTQAREDPGRYLEQIRDYLSALYSWQFPDEVNAALDRFIQGVTIEGGLSLAGLSLREMKSFLYFLAVILHSPLDLARRPFNRIVINNENGLLAAARRLSDPALQPELPLLDSFIRGEVQAFTAFGLTFALAEEAKVLYIF
jgi:radical SAM superfamily enzyme YgiQ (UPF0313 family)